MYRWGERKEGGGGGGGWGGGGGFYFLVGVCVAVCVCVRVRGILPAIHLPLLCGAVSKYSSFLSSSERE